MGRPKNADGQRTRQAILDAALDLFADCGYFGTSLRDVATAVGVRESALYNYFRSKEALFDALLTAHQHGRLERLATLEEGRARRRGAARAVRRRHPRRLVEPHEEKFFRILMSDGMRLARDGRHNLYERMSSGREWLHDVLRRMIRRGELAAPTSPCSAWLSSSPLMMWRQLHAIDADLPADPRPPRVRPAARPAVPARRRAPPGGPPSGPPCRRRASRNPAAPSRVSVSKEPCRVPSAFRLLRRLRHRRRRLQCQRQRRPVGAGGSRCRPGGHRGRRAAADPLHPRSAERSPPRNPPRSPPRSAGRIVATPVERGSRVGANADLVRISATEVEAQAREAEANAAQIAARLGIAGGAAFDVDPRARSGQRRRQPPPGPHRVRPRRDAAQEPAHLAVGVDQQKSAQLEAAERQYDVAANGAEQQYQSLMAARARMNLAQKAVADTVVRAPFPGLVGERFVSVGDYVTKGTKVASVMRVDPLRIELTVPAQYVSQVAAGRGVNFAVDSYPGETFTGQVRYVSPSVDAATRALTLEAVVPNPDGRLKPGFFATARIEESGATPGIVVPAAAVRHRGRHRARVRDRRRPRRRAHRDDRAGRWRSDRDHRRAAGRRARGDVRRGATGRRRPRRGEVTGHAVACRAVRPAPGVRLGAGPVADRRRPVRLRPAGRRSLSQHRHPDHLGDHAAARAAPEQIETEVTDKIEEAVNTISAIDTLSSTSSEGISQVVVAFTLDKDGDTAAQEVRDRVNRILPQLPRTALQPTVEKLDPTASPVITVAVTAAKPVRDITEFADKVLRRRLESADGVGQVVVIGGRKRQVNVWLDGAALRAQALSVNDVARALQAQNADIPGGRLDQGAQSVTLRTRGRIPTVEGFGDVVLRESGGHAVRLSDVARVEDGMAEPAHRGQRQRRSDRAAAGPQAVGHQHRARSRQQHQAAARRSRGRSCRPATSCASSATRRSSSRRRSPTSRST